MKQIEQFNDHASYSATGKPEGESRVSHIKVDNAVNFDGVNVEVNIPEMGDAVYHDGQRVRFYKGATLNHAKLSAAGLTAVSPVFGLVGNHALIIDKNSSSEKYADVIQFWVSVPSESGALTMGAQFVTAGTTTSISVDYEAGMPLASAANTYEANDTSLCGRINTALANLSGITGDWWAYMDQDGNVILQRDTWTEYRQYTCSGALTFVTWEDMPASSSYLKINGKTTSNRGIMNYERFRTKFSADGRELNANVAVGSESADPMKLSEFQSSQYAAEIRAYYKTYDAYLHGEFDILTPQKFGAFNLQSGKELTEKYASHTAPTKNGGTKYKFPAFRFCGNRSYSIEGLGAGSWFLPGVQEGLQLMNDDSLSMFNRTASKMALPLIGKSTYRWLAQRSSVSNAWYFNGSYGTLYTLNASSAYTAQAVALLKIKN